MKNFITYFIIFVLFFLFVEFVSAEYINSMYHDVKNYQVLAKSPKISMREIKTTNMNGKLIGTITNNTDHKIESLYIKADYYSKQNNFLGTKYAKIESLGVNATQEFAIQHRFSEVDKVQIDTTTNIPEIDEKDLIVFGLNISEIPTWAWIVAGGIVVYYMPAGYLFGWFPF